MCSKTIEKVLGEYVVVDDRKGIPRAPEGVLSKAITERDAVVICIVLSKAHSLCCEVHADGAETALLAHPAEKEGYAAGAGAEIEQSQGGGGGRGAAAVKEIGQPERPVLCLWARDEDRRSYEHGDAAERLGA